MTFTPLLASYYENRFKSNSQAIRVASERWAVDNLSCPSCTSELEPYPNNMKVSDFYCMDCTEKFQLKSSAHGFSRYVQDGAYYTQIESIKRGDYPSLLLLSYRDQIVQDVIAVHRSCIIPEYFVRRKPLSASARRAFWIGSKIALFEMPSLAKVQLVLERKLVPSALVREKWEKAGSLLEAEVPAKRGWLADVLKCVEEQFSTFTLQDLYTSSEDELQEKHPENRNVRPKIRQQLQVLRDLGIVEFVRPGVYSLCNDNVHRCS